MKILFMISDLTRGGAQTLLLNLVHAIPRERYDVELISFGPNITTLPDFESLNVKVHQFSNKRLTKKFKAFKSLINEIQPDIVHTHIALCSTVVFLFLRLCGVKHIVQTVHRFFPTYTLRERINEFFSQFFVSKLINISEFSHSTYKRSFFQFMHKSHIIGNGVNSRKIIELSKSSIESFEGNCFHIVSISNILPRKGYEFSVQAIGELIKKYPQVKYHIVGQPHEDSTVALYIHDYIAENNLEASIILHGHQDNVAPFLAAADLFLTPSEQEILPMSIIEAMTLGVPVVATSVGAIPEMLGESNEYGFLIPPANIRALEDAIEKLLINPLLLSTYARKSNERAKIYKIENSVSKYVSLYDEMMG